MVVAPMPRNPTMTLTEFCLSSIATALAFWVGLHMLGVLL